MGWHMVRGSLLFRKGRLAANKATKIYAQKDTRVKWRMAILIRARALLAIGFLCCIDSDELGMRSSLTSH